MGNTHETQGTEFYRGAGTGSPETFNKIPGLQTIDPVGSTRGLTDVTDLDDESRNFRLAIKEGQEIQLEGNYDQASTEQEGLRADHKAGTRRNFKMVLTDTSAEVTFTALVTAWNFTVGIDNVYKLRVTLKPTTDLLIDGD